MLEMMMRLENLEMNKNYLENVVLPYAEGEAEERTIETIKNIDRQIRSIREILNR